MKTLRLASPSVLFKFTNCVEAYQTIMLFYKVILISVSIVVCAISSAKSNDSEGSRIESLTRVMKSFLEDVRYSVDYNLKIPNSFKYFDEIRHRFRIVGDGITKSGRSIRNKKEHFDDFLNEYGKLTKFTGCVVEEYLTEIDALVENGCKIGTANKRKDFGDKYTMQYFDNNLKLEGFGKDDERIEKLEQELKGEAERLVEKIGNLMDSGKICDEDGEEVKESIPEGTRIESVVRVMKLFLEDVYYCVDLNLLMPKSLKKFNNIRYRYWITRDTNKFARSIRNTKEHFDDFLEGYEKLVTFTSMAVEAYLKRINLFEGNGCKIGTKEKRETFCAVHNPEYFDKELELEGFGKDDKRIKEYEKTLKENAKKLVDRIRIVKDSWMECDENGQEKREVIHYDSGYSSSVPLAF